MRGTAKLPFLILALFTGACSDDVLGPGAMPESAQPVAPAPVMAAAAGAIPDRWIVVLRQDTGPVASAARTMIERSGGLVGRSFDGALRGFSATLSAADVERLRLDPAVAYIEQDAIVRTTGALPWNLERIGMAPLPVPIGTAATGAGVTAYVIDTGIRTTHAQFEGRARDGFDAIDGGAADDCNGHGTHVAGTIGGADTGVAPDVSIVAVRVLDCGGTGTLSGVIAGIDWVASNAVRPAVANLSLAGAGSRAVDEAVQRAIDAGVVFVVAAGNDGRDACDYSPARAPSAITVGATSMTDAVWALSNQGACVDLFAPGVDIVSAGLAADDATTMMSGTSMAAPHAAGAAALRLEEDPNATPAEIAALLRHGALHGRLDRLATGSADLLLQVRVAPTWRELRESVR
ncbi:MAG TPA: S8 family peptidase [Thermoanaerobaculia bacterium]